MRINVFASILAFALGAVVISVAAEGRQEDHSETFRQLELFGDVLSRIESDYVTETDQTALIEAAIDGMLASLDPHSAYHNPDAYEDLRVTTRGEYGGLGMEVTKRDEYITIVSPISDTPAERAGLRTNDRIIAVDGDSIIGITVDSAVEMMRGAVGEPVTITISRGTEDPFDVTLVRDTIPLRTVATRIDDGIPYLRIAGFNERTTEMLLEGISDLEEENGGPLPGLILDIRYNPGGLLDQAIGVTDVFLDGGEVVSTRNRMTSFGKGSVQTIIPLRGGRDGALRLTTGRYYTPAGRSIQGTGIVPDLQISSFPISEDEAENAHPTLEADLPGALENESGAERADADIAEIEQPPADWPETEDYQLSRAREILRQAMESQQAALH